MLSAIGVIISIIYLGAQIRIQNEKSRKHRHTDEFCALIDRHIKTAKPTILRRLRLSVMDLPSVVAAAHRVSLV